MEEMNATVLEVAKGELARQAQELASLTQELESEGNAAGIKALA